MSNKININLIKKEQKYKEGYLTFIEIEVSDDYGNYSFNITDLYPEYANIEDLKAIEIFDLDLLDRVIQNIDDGIYIIDELYDAFYNLKEVKSGLLINGNYYEYKEIEHILNKNNSTNEN